MVDSVDNLVLEQLRAIRSEQQGHRTLLLSCVDYMRRVEQRVVDFEQRLVSTDRKLNELRADLELMFKAELMGQLANFETRIEAQLDRISDRVSALEAR